MEVEDFLLDLDAILRIGEIAGDIYDDAITIEAALTGAREKYGIHFESDEAFVLRDKDGSYCGSSMTINIQGTFDVKDKASINYLIARFSDVS